MPKTFDRLGVKFQYPDNWTLDDSDAVAGRESVTIYSPAGPFWSLAIHPGDANLESLGKDVVETIQGEYTEVEVEPLRETLLDEELVGYEMHFFYLDLITTIEVRCFRLGDRAYTVYCQGEDRGFDALAKVFQAMTVSLISGLKASPPSAPA